MTTEIAQQQQAGDQQKNIHLSTSTSSTISTNSLNTSNKDDLQLQQHHGLVSPLDDANVKFPLQDSWSFWFYKNEKTKTWKENVKFITTVDFVEDFWGVYNHLQLVSKLSPGCDFMLFKKDIPPMWEDPQNRDGGRWVLSLDKKNRSQSLDIYWLNSLLALVGDQFFDQSSQINGVWVNVRLKGDKLALWTKDAKDADAQMKIGRRFKEILNLKDNTLQYEEHDESNKKASFIYEC